MKLGIVGHEAAKFTPETQAAAIDVIHEEIKRFGATAIVSGHCHLGGVDIWAEEIAKELGIFDPELIFTPKQRAWKGTYGYEARNLDIARHSDVVLVVVVRELPPNYRGMRFDGCYHCRYRVSPHVKSGACWTAWHAQERLWRIV